MRLPTHITALIAYVSVPLVGQATIAPFPLADEVIAKMFAHEVQRETATGEYTSRGTNPENVEARHVKH
jgi:hypothetical protein